MGGCGKTFDLLVTPTWIVAAVCSIIIILCFLFERALHYLGKLMKGRKQKPLYKAVLKVKEELMLLGFISFLLAVFPGRIKGICIPKSYLQHMLPCTKEDLRSLLEKHEDAKKENHCEEEGLELFSFDGIHQLHIFIFVLAVTHVALTVVTICLGALKIRQWSIWEETITKEAAQTSNSEPKLRFVRDEIFIKKRDKKCLVGWLHSFVKQFHTSITKHDYKALRWGFIQAHCQGDPQFNFHKYIMLAYEVDFSKVVGISWYLWGIVVVFLLMNVGGWQTLFWMTLIPLVLLLAVGTKLEHIIAQLAKDVADKNTAVVGEVEVRPSEEHFWFRNSGLLLHLIHFILFQNAFEIAFFFWSLATYGFGSCIMGKVGFVIPTLIFGVIIQLVCSFSTLPIYAIVTQMGTNKVKKTMNLKHMQKSFPGWAEKARGRAADDPIMTNQVSQSVASNPHAGNRSPDEIQLQEAPLLHSVSNGTPVTSKLQV